MSRRPQWWLTVLAWIWPITWISAKATHLAFIGPVIARLTLPLFSKRNLNISYLPINEEITIPGSKPLPVFIVEELIRRSTHRVIINRCTCRDARRRPNHPVELGCTLLGDGTKEIDPRIARHVSVEEAIQHLHETIREGLIPMTGRVKIDNFIWGVKDRGKLLTICHCCRCCCTILESGKYLPKEAADSIVRLHDLYIEVDTEKCTRCGTCVGECFMGAIKLTESGISHDPELCKGCGRCSTVCPAGATQIRIEDIESAIREITGRIESLVDFE